MIVVPWAVGDGAHVAVADWLWATAVMAVGAAGSVVGVTLLDTTDGRPVPSPLVAVTVKVYVRPSTSVET